MKTATPRITGETFRPMVFAGGTYTIRIGDWKHLRILEEIELIGMHETDTIAVELN